MDDSELKIRACLVDMQLVGRRALWLGSTSEPTERALTDEATCFAFMQLQNCTAFASRSH